MTWLGVAMGWAGICLPTFLVGAPEAAPVRIAPACQAILLGSDVLVGGKRTGLTHDEPAQGVRRIRTWPYDDASVLVAWQVVWEHARRAEPDGTIWQISCADPAARRAWLVLPGADFGSGALDSERRLLYVTGPRGVVAVGLTDGQVRELTQAPPLDDACWLDPEDGEADHQIDVVTGLSQDGATLGFERGAPCGFEGDWVAHPFELQEPASAAPALHRPHPVAAVAVDARGELWVGDAGRCDEPGTRDRQSASTIWRSRDLGDSWEPVEVVAEDVRMHTAALVVVADPKQAGHLAVLSAVCRSAAALYGGRIFLTRDAGTTWAVARLPEGAGKPVALTLPEGGLGKLSVWADGRSFVSTDDGKTWQAGMAARPAETWRTAERGPVRFEATVDGLWRRAPTLPPTTRVFPNGDVP